jgi:hypothetical protein
MAAFSALADAEDAECSDGAALNRELLFRASLAWLGLN